MIQSFDLCHVCLRSDTITASLSPMASRFQHCIQPCNRFASPGLQTSVWTHSSALDYAFRWGSQKLDLGPVFVRRGDSDTITARLSSMASRFELCSLIQPWNRFAPLRLQTCLSGHNRPHRTLYFAMEVQK
jgi:hypothetical protein